MARSGFPVSSGSKTVAAAIAAWAITSAAPSATNAAELSRPFRGDVPMSVILCKYKGADAPAKPRQYYADMAINAGTGGHADYWDGVSYGSVDLGGSTVKGWYTLDKTADQARQYGGGGSGQRIQKYRDCIDKAEDNGYTPPDDHLVIAITSPGIDVFGIKGGAFVGENADVGTFAHEVGHGLGLRHSFSNDFDYKNASWAAVGEYDNPWDLMGAGNVFGTPTGRFGLAPIGPNAYHRDRLGWIPIDEIRRFGAGGDRNKTVTLSALTRPDAAGDQLVRIPYDPDDPYRYLTLEYRVSEGWDAGLPDDRVLIHDVRPHKGANDYKSFLLREHRPVVIAGPPSHDGPHPGIVRLRGLDRHGIDARFQEWNYREREHDDSSHRRETIPYLTIQPGRHDMPGDAAWEAGTFHLDDTREWVRHRFHKAFPGRPKLFLTMQTADGRHAAAVRARNVDAEGFEASLVEEQALNDGHVPEVVGYLAVYDADGQGQVPDAAAPVDYSTTTARLDDTWTSVAGVDLHLEEEKSTDQETGHVNENVDVLRVAGRVFAQPVTHAGDDPIAVRRRQGGATRGDVMESGVAVADESWKTVSFDRDFENPVVIAGPPSYRGSHPGVVRLKQVGSGAFGVRFQEWDYRARDHNDTNHADENIPFVAVESGRHRLDDGTTWEAGTFKLDGTRNWRRHSFDTAFNGNPKLFLTVQSNNGGQAITVRARNVTKRGFEAAFMEEEALNDGHLEEEVGYLAIHAPNGSGTAPIDGRATRYTTASRRIDHQWTSVAGVQLQMDEETSVSEETEHTNAETVDILTVRGRVLAQDVSTNGADPASLRQRYGPPNSRVIMETGVMVRDTAWAPLGFGGQYGIGPRPPKVAVSRKGIDLHVVSTDPANGTAKVAVAVERNVVEAADGHYGPNTCQQGFVWREADARDYVCVPPVRRAQVRAENRKADQRVKPGGGAYGPDTCKEGFVWREAFPSDHVCVPASSRAQAREENRKAHQRLAKPGG